MKYPEMTGFCILDRTTKQSIAHKNKEDLLKKSIAMFLALLGAVCWCAPALAVPHYWQDHGRDLFDLQRDYGRSGEESSSNHERKHGFLHRMDRISHVHRNSIQEMQHYLSQRDNWLHRNRESLGPHNTAETGSLAPVPEPATILLLSAGLAGLIIVRSKRHGPPA